MAPPSRRGRTRRRSRRPVGARRARPRPARRRPPGRPSAPTRPGGRAGGNAHAPWRRTRPTPTEGLAGRPSFRAPAAHGWGRTVVEPRVSHPRSGSRRACMTRPRTPRAAHRSNRRHRLSRRPSRSGRSRPGPPTGRHRRTGGCRGRPRRAGPAGRGEQVLDTTPIGGGQGGAGTHGRSRGGSVAASTRERPARVHTTEPGNSKARDRRPTRRSRLVQVQYSPTVGQPVGPPDVHQPGDTVPLERTPVQVEVEHCLTQVTSHGLPGNLLKNE